MSEPEKPDYIPDDALRWTMVTDGMGRRVGAWVERSRRVRIFDPEDRKLPWEMRQGDYRENWDGDVLTPELFDKCAALRSHSGSGYVSIDEPENADRTDVGPMPPDADEHETPSGQVRIVQILFAPDGSPWQCALLGLGEDGRLYYLEDGEWLREAGRVGETLGSAEGSAGE